MASSISTGSHETIDKLVQLENGLLTYQEGYLIPVTKIKIRTSSGGFTQMALLVDEMQL